MNARRSFATLIAISVALLVVSVLVAAPPPAGVDGMASIQTYRGDPAHASATAVMAPNAPFGSYRRDDGNERWLKIRIGVDDRDDRYVLERDADIESADVYAENDGALSTMPSGAMVPYARRPIPALAPAFFVPPQAVRGAPLFIHEKGGPPSTYRVTPLADFLAHIVANRLLYGTYFGVLLAVAIYHLLMFSVLGNRDFLLFGCYVAALALQQAARTHVLDVVLPQFTIPPRPATALTFAVYCLSSAALFRSYLQLPQREPLIDRALLAGTALAVAASVFAAFVAVPLLDIAIQLGTVGLLAIVLLAALRATRRGVRSARLFTVAFFGLVAGAAATVAKAVLPSLPGGLHYGFEAGTTFEALALALGIADRIAESNEAREREQSELTGAYARFVPRAFLDLLGRHDIRDVRLGDQVEREMTFMFTDVRSFTTLSESMSPAETFAFINGLLARTGPLVREHNGVIDKYIGDAIMALFGGAPDDAIDAAIAVQRAVHAHNAIRIKQSRLPVAVGVGLHRGRAMLGTIGENERMDGTVIADAVNLASRIEGLTKYFHAQILASDAVVQDLVRGHANEMRYLGQFAVKGKSEGIGLHEVFSADDPAVAAAKRAHAYPFDLAVDAFGRGKFADAERGFSEVLAMNPADGAAAWLRERARLLARSDDPWNGVDKIDEK